jgi:hypothetical protein
MSSELETLDQLEGGDLRLSVVRGFYPDDDAFNLGVLGQLSRGDVRLLTADQTEVPRWPWRELFVVGVALNELDHYVLSITDREAKKV